MEDKVSPPSLLSASKSTPLLPPINTCVPLYPSRNVPSSPHARESPPPPPPTRTPTKISLLTDSSNIKNEHEDNRITNRSGETPLRGHHDFMRNVENSTSLIEKPMHMELRAVSPTSSSTSTMSTSPQEDVKCKLTKCCVCERGVPESFSNAKPVSWYAVCRLTMWALAQDVSNGGRKWFSLGRDICPFVEAHKWICGREFTTNWRTTIGITMSSSVKKQLFLAGNPNELGLGYYSLPDNCPDPYLETQPQPVGRVYKSPSSVSQSAMSSFQIIPVQPTAYSYPSTPTTPPPPGLESMMSLATASAQETMVQGPLKKRKILPGESVHRLPRQNKERKHTTDAERQLLTNYYNTFNTCTTCPEFTELMNKLSWDYHRTKIWLYNRKTYKQVRPADKKKRQKVGNGSTSTSPVNNQGTFANFSSNDPSGNRNTDSNNEDDSDEEFYIDDDDDNLHIEHFDNHNGVESKIATTNNNNNTSPTTNINPNSVNHITHNTNSPIYSSHITANTNTNSNSITTTTSNNVHNNSTFSTNHNNNNNIGNNAISSSNSVHHSNNSVNSILDNSPPHDNNNNYVRDLKSELAHEYVESLEKVVEALRSQLAAEKQARVAAVSQCMLKDDRISKLEQSLAAANRHSAVTSELNVSTGLVPDSEVLLLRQQVEMYCTELREEKQKRGEQEMRAFDHLAQINVLTLRNLQLEKALKKHQSITTGSSSEPSISININNNVNTPSNIINNNINAPTNSSNNNGNTSPNTTPNTTTTTTTVTNNGSNNSDVSVEKDNVLIADVGLGAATMLGVGCSNQ